MTTFLVGAGILVSLALLVLRSLVVDEVKGRIQRILGTRLEHIIDALPSDLQDEWGEEWRAELAAIIAMPISAALWVRGVGHSAVEFAAAESVQPGATPSAVSRGPMHDILIEELELEVLSYDVLKRAGIQTVGDLISKSEQELKTIPRIGIKTLDEIVESLHIRGLDLRPD